ncbi:MAG: hypothetical protein HYU64_08945 [Armatimonadetes bacterium]|nr:hypothetical protein [Armatimonadota bacterium]
MGKALFFLGLLSCFCLNGQARSGDFVDSDYEQHILRLKNRVSDRVFTFVAQKPFVVIGDEQAPVVRKRATGTVGWAVEKLKAEYFKNDPEDILDIWLFKDGASYRKHAKELFGDSPGTPFGYYSPSHKALIMNIETGGGTLVHEIVHPFMHANFPECPPWFNEGLGSLYEQCGEKNGRIYGTTNWRLEGLKKEIRAGLVPSFETLTSASEDQFYRKDRGTNYGQARYLCYYLQEKGLLTRFYHEFHARRKSDPTGFKTLKGVLNEGDMEAFQRKWEAFVLELHFP